MPFLRLLQKMYPSPLSYTVSKDLQLSKATTLLLSSKTIEAERKAFIEPRLFLLHKLIDPYTLMDLTSVTF